MRPLFSMETLGKTRKDCYNQHRTTGSKAETLGKLNPLRYRGYVYDQETGLYYLQSRYYDPEIGRFINADALVTTGQSFVGNNMFAYCGNNPVTNVDYTGTRYCAATTIRGETKGHRKQACEFQCEVAKNNAFRREYAEELAVLEGETSTYKGVPVVRSSLMDQSAFSCGIIILGENITDPNILRHEYGHVLQLAEIGVSGYISFVVIPSVTCYWATEAGLLSWDYYYDYPWEAKANQYGNAKFDTRSEIMNLSDSYWLFAKRASFLFGR